MPQNLKKGRGNSSHLPFGFRYYSGLGINSCGKDNGIFIVAGNFSLTSCSTQHKYQLDFALVLTSTQGKNVTACCKHGLIRISCCRRPILFRGTGRNSISQRRIFLVLNLEISAILSFQFNMQGFTSADNVLRNTDLRCTALPCSACALLLCFLTRIGSCQVSFDRRSVVHTSIFTKVNGRRDSPLISLRNLIKNLRFCSCASSSASLRAHIRVSCKHRGRADGHRQRSCEEQGGCFLRQFHNQYLAMGPAADGQPWICLLLSHLMVVYPQFSFFIVNTAGFARCRGLSPRSVSASRCRCWSWWCGPKDRAGTPHRPGNRRG